MNSFNSFFKLTLLIVLLNVSECVKGQVINIGLLINDESHVDAKYAAELAVEQANIKYKLHGRKLELITLSMKGAWGTGSKKAVDLIFQDNVWAIIGSHNGRNAHLVEQVAAKTRTIFLSAWATDPTLSKAFVPWYFNCVSNSEAQASSIVNEIYQNRKLKRIISISDNSYDSKHFLNSFINTSNEKGLPGIVDAYSSEDLGKLIVQLKKIEFDGVVLTGNSLDCNEIVNSIRKLKIDQPIFSPSLDFGVDNSTLKYFENTVYIDVNISSNPKWKEFRKVYLKRFKKEPGLIAAYAYDAANIIIESIIKSNFNKDVILPSLSTINHTGVTGTVQFDKNGNRIGKVNLLEVKNGFIGSVVR